MLNWRPLSGQSHIRHSFYHINSPVWFLTYFPRTDNGFDYPNNLCIQNALWRRLDAIEILQIRLDFHTAENCWENHSQLTRNRSRFRLSSNGLLLVNLVESTQAKDFFLCCRSKNVIICHLFRWKNNLALLLKTKRYRNCGFVKYTKLTDQVYKFNFQLSIYIECSK